MATEEIVDLTGEEEGKQPEVEEEESLPNYFANMLSHLDMEGQSDRNEKDRLKAFRKLRARVMQDDSNLQMNDPDLLKLRFAIIHGELVDSREAFATCHERRGRRRTPRRDARRRASRVHRVPRRACSKIQREKYLGPD